MQSGLNDMDCQFVTFPIEFRQGTVSRSNFVYFRIFTVHIGQEFCTHGATAGRARTLLSGIRSISSGTIIKSLSATIYIKSDEFSSMKVLVSFSTFIARWSHCVHYWRQKRQTYDYWRQIMWNKPKIWREIQIKQANVIISIQRLREITSEQYNGCGKFQAKH